MKNPCQNVKFNVHKTHYSWNFIREMDTISQERSAGEEREPSWPAGISSWDLFVFILLVPSSCTSLWLWEPVHFFLTSCFDLAPGGKHRGRLQEMERAAPVAFWHCRGRHRPPSLSHTFLRLITHTCWAPPIATQAESTFLSYRANSFLPDWKLNQLTKR